MPLLLLFQDQQKMLTQEHIILGKVNVDANTSELLEFLPACLQSQLTVRLKSSYRQQVSSEGARQSHEGQILTFPSHAQRRTCWLHTSNGHLNGFV